MHRGHVIGKEMVDEFSGVRTADGHFSHVGYVENAAARAHGTVFFGNAFVLDGHVESGKRTHLCAQRYVAVIKTCLFCFVHDIRIKVRSIVGW